MNLKVKFIIAGLWNTLFGWLIGIILYYSLSSHLDLVYILILSNYIAITNAFLLQKYFVFCSNGPFWPEYFKMFVSYGLIAIVGSSILWSLVEIFGYSFLYSQTVVSAAMVIFGYIMSKHFTFNHAKI